MNKNLNKTPNYKMFSIVIPTFKSDDLCIQCAKSATKQSLSSEYYEVIVVDDGFTLSKRTLVILNDISNIRIIQKPHTGVCGSRNKGIENASGKYVVFVDQDCLIHPDLLKEYKDFISKHPHIVAIGGQVLSIKSKKQIVRYCEHRGYLQMPVLTKGQITSIITANACFKKDILLDIGMFSTELDKLQLSVGGEDQDISFLLIKGGYLLGYCPDAIVWHFHKESLGGFIDQQIRNGRGLALHSFLRDRSLAEIGLPNPIWWEYLIHFIRYIFISTEDRFSVIRRIIMYTSSSNLSFKDKLYFPFFDIIRRLSLIYGVSQGKRIWNQSHYKKDCSAPNKHLEEV